MPLGIQTEPAGSVFFISTDRLRLRLADMQAQAEFFTHPEYPGGGKPMPVILLIWDTLRRLFRLQRSENREES